MKTLGKWLLACAICLTGSALRADENDAQIDSLIKQLKSPDSDMRREAAKKLGELGPDAKKAGPGLVTALKTDKDLFVRRFAAQSLGQVEADPKLAVPALATLLKEDSKELTEAAITSLGKMGSAAVPALTGALKSKDGTNKPKKADKKAPKPVDHTAFLRAKAAQALGELGAEAKTAVPALIDALKDTSIRNDAVAALGNIGPAAKDAVSALRELTTGKGAKKDKGLKSAVNEAIKKIEKG
jgi:HEAT repeat protein